MAIYCLLMLNLCLFASWHSEKELKYTQRLTDTQRDRPIQKKMNRKDNLAQYCSWLDVGELFFVSL